jgi:iron(III) transport system permease protein
VSAGALLTFVLSIADFGTPAIVGGKVRVLATTAYNLFASEMTGNPGLASATSVVLIALSMVVVVLQRASVRRRNVAGTLIRKPEPKRLGPLASVAAHAVAGRRLDVVPKDARAGLPSGVWPRQLREDLA